MKRKGIKNDKDKERKIVEREGEGESEFEKIKMENFIIVQVRLGVGECKGIEKEEWRKRRE
jgi:hypothetical protein